MAPPSLTGVRVLDLSRILAGPFATQILADHGAEVIKVERPGKGDDTRGFGPPFIEGVSTYFLSINRNKKSVAIDLKTPTGRDLARRLARQSDVVIENFRPGAAARLGLDAATLRADNPRLVYCSISGFGQTGPWRDRPGYDLAVQGISGLQSITGAADGPPTKVGTSIADLTSGMYAAQGILLALFRRERTGRGDVVDVALLDSVVSLLTYQAGIAFAGAGTPHRAGNAHPSIVPYETFRASDAYLNLAVGNDRLWAAFCRCADAPALATDPRFTTNADRVAHREALLPRLQEIFATDTAAAWVRRLQEAGIPCGLICDVNQTLALPQVQARQMVVPLEHPEAGTVRTTGVPVKLTEAPGAVRTAPPLLGEHTRQVLTDVLGLTPEALSAARQAGAIDWPDSIDRPDGGDA